MKVEVSSKRLHIVFKYLKYLKNIKKNFTIKFTFKFKLYAKYIVIKI